jgi:ABC-type nitrate/sulfonate/bicarbonate transport system substrate-binding protein
MHGQFRLAVDGARQSTLDVKDLNGKKVAITSAGSGSDLLALWTIQEKKIDFTRVPVGGGGLVPNLLAGNVDAAVVYSPLSFQIAKSGEARTILDYAKGGAAEPHRGLDRARQIRAGKAGDGAEDAERALWRAGIHAQ